MRTSNTNIEKLRVLVVGVGFTGTLHARTVRRSPQGSLCGVVDRSEPVANAIGMDLDVPAFTDLTRAIENTQPDAAVIATSDPDHRAPAETLINAGVSVLIEKPLATTLEDAQAIAGLARDRRARFMTGHITRFYPRYTQAVDVVRCGDIGNPVLVTISTWGQRPRGARASNSTNPLWHFAIHDIEIIQRASGGVIEEVDGAQLVQSSSGSSVFAATGSLSTRSSFHLATGWTLPDTATPKWDLKVHCENGLVQAPWSTDGLTVYTPDDAKTSTAWPGRRYTVRSRERYVGRATTS